MIPHVNPVWSPWLTNQTSSDGTETRETRPGTKGLSATATGRDTARAIDPPAPADAADVAASLDQHNLHPPDPDAPTGPPPSFEASFLDRVREEALSPPDAQHTEAEDATEATKAEMDPQRGAYEVPPSAEQRAERDVATIRNLEDPGTPTVNVSH